MTIELVTTDGIFALDGGEWEVTNNIWLVGDDKDVLIFDAAHDHQPIVEAVNGRNVTAIVLTHGHNDHINAAVALREAVDAPILLHEFDRFLWDVIHPDHDFDGPLEPGRTLVAGGHELGDPAHAGPLPRLLLLPRCRDRRRHQRRHALLWRARCNRARVLRRTDDPGNDPQRAACPAR